MDLIVIRGGGDIASGVAHRLFNAGFNIVILEIDKPLSIRRKVSFSEAIYDGSTLVEGVTARCARNLNDIFKIIGSKEIPVYIDKEGLIIKDLKPIALVDCILAKKNLGTKIDQAPITIGVGPGFTAGVDVDLVVESMRGHNLGKVIYNGPAMENTGIPSNVLGYGEERVIRASSDGIINNIANIGDKVDVGTPLCSIEDTAVEAKIKGVIRGLIKEGIYVYKGQKIGDIDPRGIEEYVYTISDKARAIGGGVLEAIMYMKRRESYV